MTAKPRLPFQPYCLLRLIRVSQRLDVIRPRCLSSASNYLSLGRKVKRRDMVGLEGFEPPTHGLGNRCSILLSYRPAETLVNLL